MSGFSAFVLMYYWQYFVSIKINAKWNGNYLLNSVSLSRVGDNSLVHKLKSDNSCHATFKRNIICLISCATALKSVDEKGNK